MTVSTVGEVEVVNDDPPSFPVELEVELVMVVV